MEGRRGEEVGIFSNRGRRAELLFGTKAINARQGVGRGCWFVLGSPALLSWLAMDCGYLYVCVVWVVVVL